MPNKRVYSIIILALFPSYSISIFALFSPYSISKFSIQLFSSPYLFFRAYLFKKFAWNIHPTFNWHLRVSFPDSKWTKVLIINKLFNKKDLMGQIVLNNYKLSSNLYVLRKQELYPLNKTQHLFHSKWDGVLISFSILRYKNSLVA